MHFLNAVTLADQHRQELEDEAIREQLVRLARASTETWPGDRPVAATFVRRGLGQAARFVSVRTAAAADRLDPVGRRVLGPIR